MFTSIANFLVSASFLLTVFTPDDLFDIGYLNPSAYCKGHNGQAATRRWAATDQGPLMITGDKLTYWSCDNGDGNKYTTVTANFDTINDWIFNIEYTVVQSSADVGASDCDSFVPNTLGCLSFRYDGNFSAGVFEYQAPLQDGLMIYPGNPRIPELSESDSATLGLWCNIGNEWPGLAGNCTSLCNQSFVGKPIGGVLETFCSDFRDTKATELYACDCPAIRS